MNTCTKIWVGRRSGCRCVFSLPQAPQTECCHHERAGARTTASAWSSASEGSAFPRTLAQNLGGVQAPRPLVSSCLRDYSSWIRGS
jgi:hypothetical protein